MATAKKKSVRKPASSAAFNLLDGPVNLVEAARTGLETLSARRKNEPTAFRSLADIKRTSIPIRHFYMQYLLGMAYLPSNAFIEIIGAEHIGKTTLAFTLAGDAALANVPVYYQETEAKPMVNEQIMRCLSRDVVTAQKIHDRAVGFDSAHEIREGIQKFEDWVRTLRGKTYVDKDAKLPAINPLLAIIDTMSKWMAPSEAAGYQDYGDNMSEENKKKLKEVGDGSNMGHAKHFHAWCRRLPYFLEDNNCALIGISHQNDKVDMGGGASYMAADAGKLYNKTKIGGKAFDQNAAIQLIMAPGVQAKNGSGDVTGTMIKVRTAKNSYGPKNRIIEYELRDRYTLDSDTYLEAPIRLDEGLAKWFADERILGTTVERKRYTCEALDVVNGDGVDISTALHANPTIMARLAKDLKIRGYEDPVTVIEQEVKEEAEDAAGA